MVFMKFEREEIQRVVSSERNFKLIERLRDYDIIDRFVIDYFYEKQAYELFANLTSSSGQYKTMITWNKQMEVLDRSCDCGYCEVQSACAHVGLLMSEVNERQPSVFPFYFENDRFARHDEYMKRKTQRYNMNLTQEFLNEKKEQAPHLEVNAPQTIHLSAQVKKDDQSYGQTTYAVGFKIGHKRKYIIKNIKNFLRYVSLEREQRYGKDFKTKHEREYFSEDASKILQLMHDLLVVNEDQYSYQSKDFPLDENTIDRFYDVLSAIANQVNVDFATIALAEQKIKLIATEVEGYIEIALEEDGPYLVGQKALYKIIPHKANENEFTCIRYEFAGRREVIDLFNQVRRRPLVLDASSLEEFQRFVLHPLTAYFEVKGHDLAKPLMENKIELFGDFAGSDQVLFTIKGWHDDQLLNETFEVRPTSSVEWMQVLDVMEQFSVEYDKSQQKAYLNLNDEQTVDFLQHGLETLKKIATIYVSDALKRLRLTSSKALRIGITFSQDLLGIDLEQDDIPKEELKDVLDAYQHKKKFYRLKNGEILSLNQEGFQELESVLEQLGGSIEDIDEGKLYVNPYRVFTLNQLGQDFASLDVVKSQSFSDHLSSIQSIDKTTITVPNSIQASLRTYQVEGFQWLRVLNHYQFGGILADDMGLGKTLQMITYMASRKSDVPYLVITPSSVLLNWAQEVQRFAPHLKVQTISGTKQHRQQAIVSGQQADVMITSYDYLRRDIELLSELEFEGVILDEAQYIKNHNSQNSKAVKQLRAKQRFALTGTPIENSLAELWSIFDFLMPGYLYRYRYFKEHFETPIIKEEDLKVTQQLRQLVQPFILRRLKKEVLLDLPEKSEMNRLIEFSEEEKRLYYANLAQVNQELQHASKSEKVSEIQMLAMLTRLRRLCCEPRTIYENIHHRSSKTEAVIEFLKEVKVEGKQTLLFSSFTSVLDLLAIELEKEGISYRMIDGRVDKEKRQERINEFQAGEVDVFLISLRAGGTGINLTAAEVVIHFDPWWNISAQNQATDRAYRIGQTQNVLVYKFIMKGSIEEKIQLLQAKKKQLSDTFVEDSDGVIASMDKDEIISLFTLDEESLD